MAALVVGVVGPWPSGAPAPAAPTGDKPPSGQRRVADAGAQIDQVAGELAGLDTQVTQLQAALAQADEVLAKAQASVEAIRQDATSRQQLEAQLVGQARAYAIQRYMYGSADSRDLLAFLSALNKPADDAVWGLATLEVSSQAALDQAGQVAKARAAVADRLAQAESDVTLLTTVRARRAQELDATTAQRAEVATRFDGVVRELGQATVNGMSTVAYDAYRKAAATLAAEQPACALRWELLAAIGKTESNHGVGRLDVFGNSLVPIIGIPIGGDTDGGVLDGDSSRDHAVGPMQFIPSTWQKWGTDANGDGKADPGNIVDAATAAGRYLCRAAGDLTLGTEAGVIRAILSYNPNQTYLRVVGARFEALASDLALGWFSAAALPPAPAPVADVAPNSGPGGREAAGTAPTLTAPPATVLTQVRVFGAQDLTTSTTAPMTIQPGECAGPTLALDPRAGFLRCGPTGSALLDPCEVAPYDATLVGCLPDPTGSPVLLRLAGPAPTVDLGGGTAVPAAGAGRRRSLLAHPGDGADVGAAARADHDHHHDHRRRDEHRPADLGQRADLDVADDGHVELRAGSRVDHDDRHDRGSRGRRGGHVGGDLHRDGRGHHHGRAEGEGPERGQGLHDVHLGADHDHGTDDDHPARRAADLRLRQRRHGHRPAGRLGRDVVGPRPPGRPGRPPARRPPGLRLTRPARLTRLVTG